MAVFKIIQIFNVYEKKKIDYSTIKLYLSTKRKNLIIQLSNYIKQAFSVRKNVLNIMQLFLRYCVRLYFIDLYRFII